MSIFSVIVAFMIVYLTRSSASAFLCSINGSLCGTLGLVVYFLVLYVLLTRILRL